MSAALPVHMTANEFIVWALQQPEGRRYELVVGEVLGMEPERAGHARAKGRIYEARARAVRAGDLPCEAYSDGTSVRVDSDTVYEPDALLRCGAPLDDGVVEVADPLVVVEVVSPSSGKRDSGVMLAGYFRLPSLRHYLIVTVRSRLVVHHQRDDAGNITTRIIRDRPVRLAPPGVELTGWF
jgi:Uma2 family endonuclease